MKESERSGIPESLMQASMTPWISAKTVEPGRTEWETTYERSLKRLSADDTLRSHLFHAQKYPNTLRFTLKPLIYAASTDFEWQQVACTFHLLRARSFEDAIQQHVRHCTFPEDVSWALQLGDRAVPFHPAAAMNSAGGPERPLCFSLTTPSKMWD